MTASVSVATLSAEVIAAALGWSLYGEQLGWIDLAGAALIAVAILLVGRSGDVRNPAAG